MKFSTICGFAIRAFATYSLASLLSFAFFGYAFPIFDLPNEEGVRNITIFTLSIASVFISAAAMIGRRMEADAKKIREEAEEHLKK